VAELPDIGLWKWYSDPPSRDLVLERLDSLPDQFGGVRVVDYADFVQPLPNPEKVMVPRRSPSGDRVVEVEEKVPTWTLYVSVAGRVKMLEAAQAKNGWRVDVGPAGGADETEGFIELGGRLVYREQVSIFAPAAGPDGGWTALGCRTGQVWVPDDKASGARRTNPFEKAQTGAVGRALGLWGFGILPGSGVASLEEMQHLRQAMASDTIGDAAQPGPAQPGPAQPGPARPAPKGRKEATEELLTVLEELRQIKGSSEEEFRAGLARYVADSLGNRDAVHKATGEISYGKLSEGQITLMLNNFRKLLASSKIDAGMGSQDEGT
jgi:hypothetical protein